MSSNFAFRHARADRPGMGSLTRTIVVGFVLGLALLVIAPGAASAKPKLAVAGTCAGNTLTGTVTVSGLPVGAQVTVGAEAQTTQWVTVGVPATFVVAGSGTYTATIGVAGLQGVKGYRLTASGAGTSHQSATIKVQDCAPPAQVPEVPAPLLIPASMLVTAAVFEGLRRRRLAVARI